VLADGVNIRIIQLVLGSDINTTQRYLNITDEGSRAFGSAAGS